MKMTLKEQHLWDEFIFAFLKGGNYNYINPEELGKKAARVANQIISERRQLQAESSEIKE